MTMRKAMKTKPWPIVIIAILNFFGPIGSALLSSLLQKLSLWQYISILGQHPIDSGVPFLFLVPWIAALAIYSVKEWSYPVFLLTTVLETIHNVHQWRLYPNYISLPTLLGIQALNLALVSYFLFVPQVRVLYFNRSVRWWESKPRYGVNRAGIGTFPDGEKGLVRITNLSEGGAFVIPSKQNANVIDSVIHLKFRLAKTTVAIDAKIAHLGAQGWGLQFIHTVESHRSILRVLKSIRKSGALSARDAVQEPFGIWAKNLLRTGKGLVPEVSEAKTKSETDETETKRVA
jgi:hypothetical protein